MTNDKDDQALIDLLANDVKNIEQESPPDAVWNKIADSIARRSKRKFTRYFAVASVVLVLITGGKITVDISQQQRIERLIVENKDLEEQLRGQILLISSRRNLELLKEIDFELWSVSNQGQRERLLSLRKKSIEQILLLQKGEIHEFSI